jgi:hypothetical protein
MRSSIQLVPDPPGHHQPIDQTVAFAKTVRSILAASASGLFGERTPNSSRLSVITVASIISRSKAAIVASSARVASLVATIAGSKTTGIRASADANRSATASAIAC